MPLTSDKEYRILCYGRSAVRGIRLKKRKSIWRVERYTACSPDSADPAAAWSTVLKKLGNAECPLLIGGALDGGTFFQCSTVGMPLKALRGAMEFELSQHLLQIPDSAQFQISPGPVQEDGQMKVNCYVFPGEGLEKIAAILTQCRAKADFFVYPLMSLEENDKAIFLPDLDDAFEFRQGQWQKFHSGQEKEALNFWRQKITGHIQCPDDPAFCWNTFFDTLLIAFFAVSGRLSASDMQILPKSLRPKRYRNQLHLAALLLFLLAGNYAWGLAQNWNQYRIEYADLTAEKNNLTAKTGQLQAKLKSMEKEQKELQRVVSLKGGEEDLVGKLAALSSVLPENVLVNNLRWNETGLDLVLQSEAEDLDLPTVFQALPFWKIGQLQQRRMGGVTSTILLKLIPAEESEK